MPILACFLQKKAWLVLYGNFYHVYIITSQTSWWEYNKYLFSQHENILERPLCHVLLVCKIQDPTVSKKTNSQIAAPSCVQTKHHCQHNVTTISHNSILFYWNLNSISSDTIVVVFSVYLSIIHITYKMAILLTELKC